jgi:hypothetical protein
MSTRTYRFTVLLCAISWFMVGLHFRSLHHLGDPEHPVPWLVLAFTVAFALVGGWELVALLRRKGPATEG